MSAILEEFRKYTDIYGLTTPDGRPCGNGLLYTALKVRILCQLDLMSEAERTATLNAIHACETVRGRFRRHPYHPDQESHDDYTGLAVIAKYIDPNIAVRILEYGESSWVSLATIIDSMPVKPKWLSVLKYLIGWVHVRYNYDNCNGRYPDKAWLGRFPHLIAVLKWAAGREPKWFEKLAWVIATYLDSPNEKRPYNQNFLLWIQFEVADRNSWLVRKVIVYYWEQFNKYIQHSQAMGVGDYFVNQSHPAAMYWVEVR